MYFMIISAEQMVYNFNTIYRTFRTVYFDQKLVNFARFWQITYKLFSKTLFNITDISQDS